MSSWDLFPEMTSRVGFLLAWSSAPLTWGIRGSTGGWGTRGRKEPFPSPTRKGQGQTETAQALAGLGWQRCALTEGQSRPQLSAGTSSPSLAGGRGFPHPQCWDSGVHPNRKMRSSLASTRGPPPWTPTLPQGANSKAEGYPGEQFWQQDDMEKRGAGHFGSSKADT